MKSISVIAHPNIALVKYWGKRDSNLNLPQNSSISMTLSELETKTTVSTDPSLTADRLTLNGEEQETQYLDLLRSKLNFNFHLNVESNNNFPTAAGLASSSSGFAALAIAVTAILDQNLSAEELSILARLGSGSATRSILGGFNAWKKGEASDGRDSHIEPIAPASHWPELQLAVCVTSKKVKAVSSRSGMQQTVESSPIYQSAWLDTIDADYENLHQAILAKDFSLLGNTAELNALKMHASMIATVPPINYWNEGTKAVTDLVCKLRKQGKLETYFTIDAGPQVKILHLKEDQDELRQELEQLNCLEDIIFTGPGEGPRIIG